MNQSCSAPSQVVKEVLVLSEEYVPPRLVLSAPARDSQGAAVVYQDFLPCHLLSGRCRPLDAASLLGLRVLPLACCITIRSILALHVRCLQSPKSFGAKLCCVIWLDEIDLLRNGLSAQVRSTRCAGQVFASPLHASSCASCKRKLMVE